jgi:hypothetical protein
MSKITLYPKLEVSVGDKVVSNGRYLRKGLRGVISTIVPPGSGRTSDIILVKWESGWEAWMKPHEVDLVR